MPKRWRNLLAGALLFILLILFFPFQSMTVPRWRLHVVDDTGALVPGISVTEHWQHYLLESEGHEQMLRSDASGRVDFPARTIRASIVARVVDTIINFARKGANAKYDAYASVVVWGSQDYETGVAIYQPGMPPQADIVVHRQR